MDKVVSISSTTRVDKLLTSACPVVVGKPSLGFETVGSRDCRSLLTNVWCFKRVLTCRCTWETDDSRSRAVPDTVSRTIKVVLISLTTSVDEFFTVFRLMIEEKSAKIGVTISGCLILGTSFPYVRGVSIERTDASSTTDGLTVFRVFKVVAISSTSCEQELMTLGCFVVKVVSSMMSWTRTCVQG